MSVPIKDAHDFIRGLLKKNKGGFISPEDIDRALNRAVNDFVSAIIFKFKDTKQFNYDHLLTKKYDFSINPASSGLTTLPTDYFEGLTIYVLNNGVSREGTLYNWDEFLEVTNSVIVYPDLNFPAATIFIDSSNVAKIQVSPVPTSGSYSYTLVYVKKPVPAVYNYTVNANGTFTYNPTNSVDLDISERFMGDIYSRTFAYLGVNLENQILLGFEGLRDTNQTHDER